MKTFAEYGITDLRGSGTEQVSTCPQCSSSRRNKKAKCLSVNMDKECWNCHHCGWTGSLKKGPDNKSNPYLWKPREYTRPMFIQAVPEDQMLAWFRKRGIPEDVVLRNRIRKDTVYMPQPEEEVAVICFPMYRGDNVVNVKYRDAHKNFRMVGGAERIFYGLNDRAKTTYIVEGEIDKLSCDAVGVTNCMSVPDGAPSPESKDYSAKFDFLENCKNDLADVDIFVLAVDNDAPGQVLEEELARRFGKERCLRVVWPEGCKDANDVLTKLGPETLQTCLSDLREFPIDGVVEVSSIRDRVINLYRNGVSRGVHPGWEYLAPLYSVKEGQMTIVTGIPSHGKSEWLDALLVNLASMHGWSFAVYSPENHPIEDHVSRLSEKYIGKSFRAGFEDRMNETEAGLAADWVNDHFYFLFMQEEALSLGTILTMTEQLVYRRGIKGLILDPWNELEHARIQGLSETEYISKSLTQVRYFARNHGVHVWIVAHPTKIMKEQDAKTNKSKYPVPTPYDISGSAHWYNKADNCISVWRDVKDNHKPTQVHIQKVKFKAVGKPGRVLFDYDFASGRLKESRDQSEL